MAVLTKEAFISKWTANFPSTGVRAITGAVIREFKDDIADSFQSILGATTITSWKEPCAVATTGNITLSGEQTIDGVLTSGSRVLVKNQTTTSQNGIYVSAAGAWSRATDADDASELEGAAVGVNQGDSNKNTIWVQTTDNITLETSAIAWQQVGYSSSVEVVDDDTFATASSTTVPSSESVKAYVDAQVGGIDYQSIEVNVSSAEILALNSSPKEIIPAPGAGSFINIIKGSIFYDYGTAAYANPAMALEYGSSQTHNSIPTMLNQTSDQLTVVGAVSISAAASNFDNQNIRLRATTANPTTGDGTLKVKLIYRIETVA